MERTLICKQDYWATPHTLSFVHGVPYQVVGEHKTTTGTTLEILGRDDKPVFVSKESVKGFFFEDVPGSLYAIRRFADELSVGEYGIDDNYYLVGAFSDRNYAIDEWKALDAKVDDDERYELFVFVPDRLYPWNKQPWLGGGRFID